MQDTVTILFTSAGRRNQLIDCFREDATRLGVRLRILAADLRPQLSSACWQADGSFEVPACNSSEYIPALVEICRREQVRLIVPTIDTELSVLSAQQEPFNAAGARVLISSPEVVKLAGDKLATAQALATHDVRTPTTLTLADYREDTTRLRWPVIAKPNSGSASIGILRPSSPEELIKVQKENYIVQELWEGTEYTVNLFFDPQGSLRCAIPHRRIEVRAGEVAKGRTERITCLVEAATRIARALPGARGPLCFQAIATDESDYAVFEINARFGGGYPLAHRSGARMSQWVLEEIMGLPSSAHDDWRPGVTMLRYDTAVFIDG